MRGIEHTLGSRLEWERERICTYGYWTNSLSSAVWDTSARAGSNLDIAPKVDLQTKISDEVTHVLRDVIENGHVP